MPRFNPFYRASLICFGLALGAIGALNCLEPRSTAGGAMLLVFIVSFIVAVFTFVAGIAMENSQIGRN